MPLVEWSMSVETLPATPPDARYVHHRFRTEGDRRPHLKRSAMGAT